MTYQDRWLLAVATSQPYPPIYATGLILSDSEKPPPSQPTYNLADVMAQRDTGAVESSGVVLVDPLTGNFTITKEKWNSLNEQGDRVWPYAGGAAAAGLVLGIIAGRLSKKRKS